MGAAKNDLLAHELQRCCWWPAGLRETQASLDGLQELSRDFIAHDMCSILVVRMQLLTCGSLVDTNHGDTNRPCTITLLAFREAKIGKESTYALPILKRR